MLNRKKCSVNKLAKVRFYLLLTLFTISISIIFSSCEDVIDIDLKNVSPQIVIDATVTDQPGPYTVKISKTGDYFAPSTFPPVSGAIVIIADNAGHSETLLETKEGIYQSKTLQGMRGRTYTLTVTVEGKEYTATSTMPQAIEIDSIGYVYQKGGGLDIDNDAKEGYKLHVYFTDPPGIKNYCRFKIQKGKLAKGIFLYNDKYTDGRSFDYHEFEKEIFHLNDTVRVELLSLDKTTYDYYSTLIDVVAAGGEDMPLMSVTPSNPNTNLSNGALGYFGAFTVRSKSIIIK